MRRLLQALILWLCAIAAPVMAAESLTRLEPINRATPRDTFQSFISAGAQIEADYAAYLVAKSPARVKVLQRDLSRLRQLLDLSHLPPVTQAKIGNAAIGYLYDILARLPAVDPASIPGVSPGTVPDPASLPTSWTFPGTDIQIVRIEGGADDGSYQFSAASIASFPEYYFSLVDQEVLHPRIFPYFHREQMNATGPWVSESFVGRLPEVLRGYHLNTPLWKILAAGLVALGLGVIGALWIRMAWHRSRVNSASTRVGWRLTIPLAVLALFGIGEWLIDSQLNPSGSFAATEHLAVAFIEYVAYAWAVWLLIYFVVERLTQLPRIAGRRSNAHLLRLAARLLSIVAVAAILVYGANDLGIPALGLIAGLGVGGIAVALASQSTLENLFGGLSLVADRPFRIGDYILYGDLAAEVEYIGPRSSRLRIRDGTLCTVPNAELARMSIVNLTQRDRCFLHQVFPLRGDSPPGQVRALLYRLRALVEAEELVVKERGWPRVRVVGTAPGRVDIEVSASVRTADYSEFLELQERVVLSLLDHLRDLELQLAQPLSPPPLAN